MVSNFRRRVTVVVDGDKFDVTTCALDNKGLDLQHADALDALRPVYNALVRCHVEGIPPTFHRFAELVDDMVDHETETDGDELDPTRPAVSDG